MDDAISKVPGVHFFSSITGTFNSSKCKKSETQKKQVEIRNAEVGKMTFGQMLKPNQRLFLFILEWHTL